LKQHIKTSSPVHSLSAENGKTLKEEINGLAQRLFPKSPVKREKMAARVWEMYTNASGKDFLAIHSPGGWGNTQWEGLLDWEKSIVTGVTSTLEKMGYIYIMMQYFRSGDSWWAHMSDIFKEARFFLTGVSYRAEVMAEELKFLIQHLPGLKVILVGASQGAAFNNAVMILLGNTERIYSLELGTFFPHMPRRVITDRTLVIDSNGLMPDPICHRDLWAGTKAYIRGTYRWFKYRIQGHPVKYTHCTNTPGHEYKWEYPAVHSNITEFLTARFGVKS
jgi:hypothetical protein